MPGQLLAMEGIEHRTLLDECFRVQGRQAWYVGTDEIQRDLDTFLSYDNPEHSHRGYRLRGRTPAQALREALGVEKLADISRHRRTPSRCERLLNPHPVSSSGGELRDLYTGAQHRRRPPDTDHRRDLLVAGTSSDDPHGQRAGAREPSE